MTARGPGRPRSESARRAIIKATLGLVDELGYGAVTMEGIARRAEVSKQTVYRWWSSPMEIVLETINQGAERAAPLVETDVFEDDLRTFVRRSVDGAHNSAKLLVALMAEAQRNPGLAPSFRHEFLERRRAVLHELLARARSRGAIDHGVDTNLVVEMFFGTLWYRLLAHSGPLDHDFADELAGALLALTLRPERT
ncbi:TetR/AcrR family transcriptional regulator [Mycolicibacterium sp. 050232]|uniref:TetR/AcrR family transcriptional regulator n=1 Tax=Mycolicibacterium sp. 050232 TaxID=3113982 RepID=UPI002E2A148C|nr:TetR/AcrR family transcriptional regulator [Mycolicibacterium sp. 050232]MED5814652.1 TetR/AcrR family transcriptional regulator [Mycolicibacterium sp. 050232]